MEANLNITKICGKHLPILSDVDEGNGFGALLEVLDHRVVGHDHLHLCGDFSTSSASEHAVALCGLMLLFTVFFWFFPKRDHAKVYCGALHLGTFFVQKYVVLRFLLLRPCKWSLVDSGRLSETI